MRQTQVDILQVKDPSQARARNNDIVIAARQPKVITTNCLCLDDWITDMLPGARKEHKGAIPLRLAACETIEESLYSGTVAQSGDQIFHPEMRSSAETAEALKELFLRG